jgi:flagellar secretion chaperone FliS
VVPRGADAYRKTEALSRSPMELVVMLYDGALRFVAQAEAAADKRARTRAVSRAIAIITELHNTLNVREGGDVAAELDRLYSFMHGRLIDVTMKGDTGALDDVRKVLITLRDGWSQVAAGAARSARA